MIITSLIEQLVIVDFVVLFAKCGIFDWSIIGILAIMLVERRID